MIGERHIGKLLFSSQCVMCHGKEAVGDGDLVERLNLDMPDPWDVVPHAHKALKPGGFLFFSQAFLLCFVKAFRQQNDIEKTQKG